ncbi:hypothetical protein LOTGIDRAFT_144591, partial [Lottia gigantea]
SHHTTDGSKIMSIQHKVKFCNNGRELNIINYTGNKICGIDTIFGKMRCNFCSVDHSFLRCIILFDNE